MMHNYPSGSDTASAPWNSPDPALAKCEICGDRFDPITEGAFPGICKNHDFCEDITGCSRLAVRDGSCELHQVFEQEERKVA